MPVRMNDFTLNTGDGPERDCIGCKDHAPSSVRQAGTAGRTTPDGFTLATGTGPRRATPEYGGPRLRLAKRPNAGGSGGLDQITTNPSQGGNSGY